MEIEELAKGHEAFLNLHFKERAREFRRLVKEGQHPKALFIGCSDSRVVPDLITGAGPGDLFVVRNIGNMVAPFQPDEDYHGTAAAIEYAVSVLGVTEIIVCGHSHCGACESLYQEVDDPDLVHVKKWLELGGEAKRRALAQEGDKVRGRDLFAATERFNVIHQLERLMTYPSVRRKVEAGEMFLHGWYYTIETGSIDYYDLESGAFLPLLGEEKE